MLPVINAFKAAHRLTDVTMVADAGSFTCSSFAGRRNGSTVRIGVTH